MIELTFSSVAPIARLSEPLTGMQNSALPIPPQPTRQITEQDVDYLIDCQRQAMRYYLRFALGLVGTGLIMLVVIFVFFGQALPDILKSLVGIGCGFVSSLSAFQFKEITPRAQSVKALTLCKMHLSSPDEAVRKRYEELAFKSLEKMALG